MEIKPQVYVEDLFTVTKVDQGGKFFEKTSRIEAESNIRHVKLYLDINDYIYPMEENQVPFFL